MSQSASIFAFLAVAFIVFITQRGELPVYMGFLLGNVSTTPSNSTVQTNNFNAGNIATAADVASTLLL